jgi:hypothetical protein
VCAGTDKMEGKVKIEQKPDIAVCLEKSADLTDSDKEQIVVVPGDNSCGEGADFH